MFRKTMILSIIIISILGISMQYSYAQKYPASPIEIVVGTTPGSLFDLLARAVGAIAPKFLGQPIVVTNKPGAGGSLGASEIITSKPDGYKLLVHGDSYFGVTVNTQKIPFNPRDLTPLVNFIETKQGLIVKGDSPWKNLSDALDFGRKHPRTLRWSHAGRGTIQNIYGSLIFRKAGIETIDVPYKGSPEMLSALLGGHVEASIMAYGVVKDHVRTGTVRYLIMVSEERYTDPSNVPSAKELGFPEVAKLPSHVGLYIHKDTPEGIKKILFNAFKKTYEDPEFQKAIEKIGEAPRFGDSEFLKEAIKNCETTAVPILKELGFFVER